MIAGTNTSRLLATTKEAASFTGLSEFELRRGFKAGRYPAIELGCGTRGHRLRWNLALLTAAIERQMMNGAGKM